MSIHEFSGVVLLFKASMARVNPPRQCSAAHAEQKPTSMSTHMSAHMSTHMCTQIAAHMSTRRPTHMSTHKPTHMFYTQANSPYAETSGSPNSVQVRTIDLSAPFRLPPFSFQRLTTQCLTPVRCRFLWNYRSAWMLDAPSLMSAVGTPQP